MWHLMVQRGINGYLVVILLIHGYSCLKKHVIANVWLIKVLYHQWVVIPYTLGVYFEILCLAANAA